MEIPRLDLAIATVEFYYDYLVQHEALAGDLVRLPTDLTAYRELCSNDVISFLDHCNL